MLSRVIAVVLVAVFLHGNLIAQTEMQTQLQIRAKMQGIVREAQKKDKAVRVILSKKIDNQKEFIGKVSEISDTGFILTDQKTGATKTLAYADVREVHQKGWSKKAIIATGVVAFFVVIAIYLTATKQWVRD